MHRRCPGVVDVPQPVIFKQRLQPPPVSKPDAQALPPDLSDPPALAIHYPEVPEIAREDDLVPRSQLNRARLEDGHIVRGVSRRLEPAGDAASFQRDPVLVAARDPPRLPLLAAVNVAVGDNDVARAVAHGVGGQNTGQAAVHKAIDLKRPTSEQPLHRVDLFPLPVGQCEEHGSPARVRWKRKPELRRRLRQPVRGKFPHVATEALNGEVRVSRNHMRDGSLEVRRALPEHIVHAGRRHAHLLQETERLPRLDGPKLEPVADKRKPGGSDPLGDALEIAHLDRTDHGRFVHHDHGTPEPPTDLLKIRAITKMPIPCEHPLQRGCANPGFKRKDTCGCRGRGQPDHRTVPCKPDDLL